MLRNLLPTQPLTTTFADEVQVLEQRLVLLEKESDPKVRVSLQSLTGNSALNEHYFRLVFLLDGKSKIPLSEYEKNRLVQYLTRRLARSQLSELNSSFGPIYQNLKSVAPATAEALVQVQLGLLRIKLQEFR